MKRHLLIYIIMCVTALSALADNQQSVQRDVVVDKVGSNCLVTMQIEPSALNLKSNHQMFITPYIETTDGQFSAAFPTVVLSGRNMHYLYLRTGQTKASGKTRYDIAEEMLCNAKAPGYRYAEALPMQPWMQRDDAVLRICVDTCGCGRTLGSDCTAIPANLSPLNHMMVMPYPTPVAEVPKILYHHGKARVEFEVDKFELHDVVYTYTHRFTGRKHVIDNRAELKVIEDSIHYALSDPNVEIDLITLCGYASPESPYTHNDYLATNRSRALAEYIAARYHLPADRCTYSAVPENWAGFREQVLEATTLSAKERQDLLDLIDRPVYGPKDYDDKERELINGAKYARLYREQIHPDWFPKLRYTDFTIQTRLKPLTVAQLHEVMNKTPELLSLNQIYAVAADCEHGGEEFHKAMNVALTYYPDDPTANCNAAALAVEEKDYEQAAYFLSKAGESNEAHILRGIVEVSRLNYDKAIEHFEKAGNAPEAQRNLQLLK